MSEKKDEVEITPELEKELEKDTEKKEETKEEEKAEDTTVEEKKSMSIMETEKSSILDPNDLMQIKYLANTFMESGSLPSNYKKPAQVIVAIQVGQEMGMKPLEAIQSLYFVNGNVSIYGKAITRRLREHGWDANYTDKENECEVVVSNKKTGEEYKDKVTFDEAEKSGYTKDSYGKLKFGWKEGMNRKIKLRYMALNLVLKTNIAEVLGNATGLKEIDGEVARDNDIRSSVEDKKEALLKKIKEQTDENN